MPYIFIFHQVHSAVYDITSKLIATCKNSLDMHGNVQFLLNKQTPQTHKIIPLDVEFLLRSVHFYQKVHSLQKIVI